MGRLHLYASATVAFNVVPYLRGGASASNGKVGEPGLEHGGRGWVGWHRTTAEGRPREELGQDTPGSWLPVPPGATASQVASTTQVYSERTPAQSLSSKWTCI